MTGVRMDRGQLEGAGGRPAPSRPIPGPCLPLWVLLPSHLTGSQDVALRTPSPAGLFLPLQ